MYVFDSHYIFCQKYSLVQSYKNLKYIQEKRIYLYIFVEPPAEQKNS